MAFKGVRIKRSSVKGKKPAPTTDLEYGDLALNFYHEGASLFARAENDTLLEWPAGLSGVTTAASAPANPRNGQLWWDSNGAELYIWYDSDGAGGTDPGQWVQVVSPSTVGDATAAVRGVVQLADAAAITAGTAGRVVDAAQLKAHTPVDATTSAKGIVRLADAAAIAAGTAGRVVDAAQLKAHVPAVATDAAAGVVELATAAETTTGTDATRAVTPAGLKVELDKKADLASPALTGTPTAPTAAVGTNTTQLATTEFVYEVAAATAGLSNVVGTAPITVTGTGVSRTVAVDAATTTAKGAVQLATAAETVFSVATPASDKAVTPAGLKANYMPLDVSLLPLLP